MGELRPGERSVFRVRCLFESLLGIFFQDFSSRCVLNNSVQRIRTKNCVEQSFARNNSNALTQIRRISTYEIIEQLH